MQLMVLLCILVSVCSVGVDAIMNYVCLLTCQVMPGEYVLAARAFLFCVGGVLLELAESIAY